MNIMSREAKASLLDSSIAGILMRFQINQEGIVSPWVWTGEYLSQPSRTGSAPPQGVMLLEEKELGLDRFVEDLLGEGFVLERLMTRKTSQVRYPLGRLGFVFKKQPEPGYAEPAKRLILPELRRLCRSALWDVAMTRNRNIDGVQGREGLFLKIGGRTPFRQKDGSLVLRRLKDGKGKPYGEPQPLVAERFLCIRAGRILVD